ncbi:hypothetical protein ASU33_02955 [Solirubrum puertoriconensis]|uniref:Secretin/TonB short N-terminal domain-containing protein n=2 Tax=Solirubrum puertoriconensis TaxID=1751427 RepID=A0A9X0HI29_SOLP1|nr:hypothetical protein ASU33_02955 [Solirubrum puertoriconensis]
MLCALAAEPVVAQVRSGSVLERKVTVTFNDAPLESVLRTLRRQYGVRISYSNTALNLKQPVTVSANNQPLRAVLSEVLRDKNIGYELVGDQVVLHPAVPKSAATKPASAPAPATTTTTVSKAVLDRTPNEAAPRLEPSKTADKPGAAPAAKPATPAKAAPTKKEPAKATKSQSATSKASNTGGGKVPAKAAPSKKESATPAQAATADKPSGQGSAASGVGGTDPEVAPATTTASTSTPVAATPPAAADTKPTTKQDSAAVTAAVPPETNENEAPARPTYREPAQISFLGPLGSNGLRSSQTVNNLSINVLGGYSAGVEGFEAAGLFNIDRDTVDGAQVAGLANIVGKHLDGVQGAGLMNVLGGGGRGWQAAGLLNVAARPIAGAQTAGLFNYVGPTKKLPVVADAAPATEAAPTRKPTVQAAGLFNVALGEVRGGQAAGLLNVAGTVHGVQLAGLLNVADSVDGVSIAPINFVRHGYHRFEVTNSEVWPVSASLKLGGSAAFYTFFTGAYAGFGNKPRRWAVGYGLGSEVWARRRLSVALDAVAMHVNEEQRGWTRDLNLDSQLRLLLGVAPFKKDGHLRIVFGPTVSVLVTQRYDTTEQQVYSNLAEGRKLWLDEGNSATRVLGWVGYTAGIRF